MLPFALMQDAIIFVAPSYFHTCIIPILKFFRKKVYVIVLDPQEVLKQSAESSIFAKLYFKAASYLEYAAVKKSDKVFAVSSYLKNKYRKWNKNTFYTPNGADVDYIAKIKPRSVSSRPTITYFGSFDRWRGVDILVNAFKRVGKKYNVRLLLLGGGKEENSIREMCRGSKNVHISGFIKHRNAIALCKASQVLVIPYRKSPILYKTMPIKTFEYVACGVPIIVTDTGEHADIIKRLGVGVVVKPGATSLAKGVDKLLNNTKFYRKIKNNCIKNRQKVDYKFTRKSFQEEIRKDA